MKVADTSELKRFVPSAPADAPRPSSSEQPETPDRVSTEESARVATAIAETSRAAVGTRAAKLQAIEAAVKSGTYRPDPQRIAQQILDAAELAAKLQAIFGK
jgi:negative regulator of flagellin synthesis FlgM